MAPTWAGPGFLFIHIISYVYQVIQLRLTLRELYYDEISNDVISYDELSHDEISDDEFSDDEISGNLFFKSFQFEKTGRMFFAF